MTLTLDTIFTQRQTLCDSASEPANVPGYLLRLAAYVVGSGCLYGFTMGLWHSVPQALAAALKVPALFFLTLGVSLPALHFVGLLFGARVRLEQTLFTLLMGLATTSILLSAFAPVALFFLLSGSSYNFLLLMHVTIFAFSGAAGLQAVARSFRDLHHRDATAPVPATPVLYAWMGLYMVVGTQMAYILSPFVGRESAFFLFYHPEGNFYSYVWRVVLDAIR